MSSPSRNGTASPRLDCLRLAAYLSPSLPSHIFESILVYLQRKLGLTYTALVYEKDERNVRHQIGHHDVDMAWVSYQTYHLLADQENIARLLPVSIVSQHAKYYPAEDSFGHFADVVIHSSLKDKIKEFYDLRGYRWAYTSPSSYSGHGLTVDRLKSMGENVNFFGNFLCSNSHLESLYLILNGKCDASAVDSNVLRIFLQQNPFFKDQLHVLTSWGELPPYPIVINNKTIDDKAEAVIVKELLSMHLDPEGRKILSQSGFIKFQPNRASFYDSLLLDESPVKSNGNKGNGRIEKKRKVGQDRFQNPYY